VRTKGTFYSCACPEPSTFASYPIHPDEARYDQALGEFVLPSAAVRTAPGPEARLLEFLDSAYAAASATGIWPP
jgi:Family of unknown function (DUF5996)